MDNLLAGDPTKLKRLKVRFSRPVLPGQKITTTAWLKSKTKDLLVLDYETKNPDGIPVIKDGVAECAL